MRDHEQLTADQQRRFLDAANQFVGDLREGVEFHPRLRVKRVQGTPDVWEMTWAPDGRTTFSYGDEIIDASPTSSGVASARTTSSDARNGVDH